MDRGCARDFLLTGLKLSTRKFRCLFTLDSDSSIIEIELEWCYTLLVSEATASPISLDKSIRFGCFDNIKMEVTQEAR